MDIVITTPDEEKHLRKQSISIDELVLLFNKHDWDRMINIYLSEDVMV